METNAAGNQKPINPFLEREMAAKKQEHAEAAEKIADKDTWKDIDEPTLDELLAKVDEGKFTSESSNLDPEMERIQYMAEVIAKMPAEKQKEQIDQLRAENPEEADQVEEVIEQYKKAS